MVFEISEQESKQARHPHEYFLINLITNHILVFVALLGLAKTYPWVMLITPSVSIIILSYLIFRAKRSLNVDPWFVRCHWQLCARRSKFFIGMMALLGLAVIGLLFSVGGDTTALKPGHYAIGGVTILPTMLTVLALIVMESDAVHKAKIGEIPNWLVEKYPNPAAKPAKA